MARRGNDAVMRSWALFVCAVSLSLTVVLPLLAGTAAEGVDSGAALVVLVVAALLASGRRYVVFAAGTVAVRAGGPSDPHIQLNGNITDPPHHPVCPRAPGLA